MGVSVYWPMSVLCAFVCVCVSVCVCVRSNQSTSKKPHYVSDLSKLIVCTPLFCWGGGGVEHPTKFSKREGGLTESQFLDGGCWEREGDFFQRRGGGFLQKN